MPFSQSFPPAPPTISTDTLSVSVYLQTPTRVHRVINDLTLNRFIADKLLSPGPRVTGGAVVYDQVTQGDFFLARDVQKIRPGMEYPTLTDTMPTPKVAPIDKWGGQVFITDEDRDRNAVDVFVRETRKLANTIVKRVDAIAIATLAAAPINTFTGASWASASGDTMIANLVDATMLINNPDMGYVADLVILNPAQFNALLKNNNFRLALQAFSPESILRMGLIGTFLGMTFAQSNRVPAGTAYIAASGMVGSIADEVPLSTNVYREEGQDVTYVKSGRRFTVYITDPKAAVAVVGLS